MNSSSNLSQLYGGGKGGSVSGESGGEGGGVSRESGGERCEWGVRRERGGVSP